jgi:hypothetical protein
MREIRTYGSEGGAVLIPPSLPLSFNQRETSRLPIVRLRAHRISEVKVLSRGWTCPEKSKVTASPRGGVESNWRRTAGP